MRAIAKKEFADYIKDFSQQEKDLFADFFYEGVLLFRKIKKKVHYTDISEYFQKEIVSQLEAIINDNKKLPKLLGLLFEYVSLKFAPGHATHEEFLQLNTIFQRLTQIQNLHFPYFIQVLNAAIEIYSKKPKPRGLIAADNPHIIQDCKVLKEILLT